MSTLDPNNFSKQDGYIQDAVKDKQSLTSDWLNLQELIAGVKVKEVKNVCKRQGGVLTEVFRADWALDSNNIEQVFQNILTPGEVSGWHAHRHTTDRIFVNYGRLRIGLYDARSNSSTYGKYNEFHFGMDRPALLLIPPGIWHAVQNNTSEPSALINIVNKAYEYDDPDHWRLPIDTPMIPYKFV